MSHENELQKAIDAIHAGNNQEAGRILVQIIQQSPRHEMAWLRLASVTKDFDKQYQCVERVLKINPNNTIAQQRMAQLQQIKIKHAQQNFEKTKEFLESRLATSQASSSKKPVSLEQNKAPIKKIDAQSATKKCPYCAEIIKQEAVVCRFCDRELNSQPSPEQPSLVYPSATEGNPKKTSNGRTIYYIFAFLIIGGFVAFVGLAMLGDDGFRENVASYEDNLALYGNKVEYNGGEVYYTSSVHRDVAERVGVFLMEIDYFRLDRKNEPVSVQVDYIQGQFQMKFIFVPGVEKAENSDSYWTAIQIGRCMAYEVFGQPISFHFADPTFKSLKVVEVSPEDSACRNVRGY